MALFGSPNVEKLKERKDIMGLIKALGYQKACWVRRQAADALGQIGDSRAVEPLIIMVEGGDESDRISAITALGEIGDTQASEALIDVLKDKNKDVRKSAAQALDQLGWLPDKGEAGASYWIAKEKWNECVQVGTAAVEGLIAALHDKDLPLKENIIVALGQIGDSRAVQPLIAVLNYGNKYFRKSTALALGQIGDVRAIHALIASYLDEKNTYEAKNAAIDALVRLCAPTGEAILTEIKVTKSPDIGEMITKVFLKIGESTVDTLINALKDDDPTLHLVAARVLGQMGNARAVEPLLDALRDNDYSIRLAAIDALGYIGDARAVSPLMAALKGETDLSATEALGRIGDPGAVEVLLCKLNDNNPSMRRSAAIALGQIGDIRSLESLIALVGDKDKGVQKASSEALVGMYQSGALDQPSAKRILDLRKTILGNHTDIPGEYGAYICNKHEDRGEKLADFPL